MILLPSSSRPVDSKCSRFGCVLGIGVDLRLHTHQLRKNFRISGEFEGVVLSNSGNSVLVNGGS